MESSLQSSLGVAHFLTQADGLARFLLLVLLVMSVATWYLIATKTIRRWRTNRHGREFLKYFWQASDLGQVSKYVREQGVQDPFSHLTHLGLRAAEQYRNRDGSRMIESGSADEFLTRALRRAIEQDTARLAYGLTVLAYNAFTRSNRLTLAELDGFAHDFFAFMSTGIRSDLRIVPAGEVLKTRSA